MYGRTGEETWPAARVPRCVQMATRWSPKRVTVKPRIYRRSIDMDDYAI
ncbi:MAG: hypothetical protein WBR26_14645 [Candidatus Acidiferrum sp.]